jgi:hypothetical protein
MTVTHRMSHTRTFKKWAGMLSRCYNPNTTAYRKYGARGITVCERWRESFENFYADMGEAPVGMSIDRITGTGNYEPRNCRWATPTEQARNRRNTIRLTAFGITKTAAEWAHETGVRLDTVYARTRLGWAAEAAVCQPSDRAICRYRGGTLRDFR